MNSALDRPTHYRRHPAALWRATRSFLVACVPPGDVVHIRGSAATVWSLLAEPVTVAELGRQVAGLPGADHANAGGDVAALVEQLVALGLLLPVSASGEQW
jgi:hypothetical protein